MINFCADVIIQTLGDGHTPIHLALKKEKVNNEMIDKLLEGNPNMNIKNWTGVPLRDLLRDFIIGPKRARKL